MTFLKFQKADIVKLESYWIEINEYRRMLRHRERDLLEGWREIDCNQGASKGNAISDTTGNKAILLADDILYQNLKRLVKAIEDIESELDSEQKVIVDMMYRQNLGYTWDDVACELGVSRNKVLRKRNVIIDKTAERLGWI